MEPGTQRPGLTEVTALAMTGYGHFTTMRIENGAVRGLGLHLERLQRDCSALFAVDLDVEHVRAELRRAVASVGGHAGHHLVARVTVFDPDLTMVDLTAPAHPRALVTVRSAPPVPQSPMRVQPVRHRRQAAAIKHVGLFESLMLRRTAQLNGYDDALFYDDAGRISEGATWNVGFIADGEVIWPHADQLPGVTMELLTRSHPTGCRRPVSLDALSDLEAVFATNAAVGVRAITAVGEQAFPPSHPVMRQLCDQYAAVAGEEV